MQNQCHSCALSQEVPRWVGKTLNAMEAAMILEKKPNQALLDLHAQDLPRWHSVKESSCQWSRHRRLGLDSWVEKILWSRKWQPTPIFLLGKFHGQRNLVGYNSRGHKESDMVKQLSIHAHTEHRCTLQSGGTFETIWSSLPVVDQIETIKHFAEEKFSYMFSILKDFPPPPDVISSGVLVNKISKKKKNACPDL